MPKTVANARLHGLHIDRAAIDSRARLAERPHEELAHEQESASAVIAYVVAVSVLVSVAIVCVTLWTISA